VSRPRDRKSAEGLLPRMEPRPWADGKTITYRYHPLGGKPINLGTDRIEACAKVLRMLGKADDHGTLRWVWEDFKARSPRWKKLADGTRADYETAWKQIDAVLGGMAIHQIDSTIVARYVHVERAAAPRRADIEKSLLSRLFGHGIKLGVCTVNATIGVEPHGSEARTTAVEPEVLARFLAWVYAKQPPQRHVIAMGAEYASLAGNRKVEFLDLTWPQVDRAAGRIRVFRAKQRGKKKDAIVEVIEITPKLEALLDRLAALRRARGVDCAYVFPTRDNNAYSARGFKTLWHRTVTDALAAKVITAEDRFTFHDLRAYYVTLHKRQEGKLPDLHTNPAVTATVYDRNEEVARRAL